MAENWTSQPDPNMLQCLALGFVDGCLEGNANQKLSPGPLKGVTAWLGEELDPWDEDFLVTANQLAHQQHIVECSLVDQLGTIAEALLGTDVSKQHHRHTWLEVDGVSWGTTGSNTRC